MNETTDKLLRDLASQLGTTAEGLWNVAVQGSTAHGYAMLPVVMIFAVLTIVCGFSVVRNYKKDRDDLEAFIPQFVLGLFFGLVGVLCMHSMVMHLLAPEYKALEMILGVFK